MRRWLFICSFLLTSTLLAADLSSEQQAPLNQKGCFKHKERCLTGPRGPRGHHGKPGFPGSTGPTGPAGPAGSSLGNYISAWDQSNETNNGTWTPVVFNTTGPANGWTHPNSTDFVCAQDGTYLVVYRINMASPGEQEPGSVSIRALNNGNEIIGSQTNFLFSLSGVSMTIPVASNFVVSCMASDTLTFEYAGQEAFFQDVGSGFGTPISASISIVRIN